MKKLLGLFLIFIFCSNSYAQSNQPTVTKLPSKKLDSLWKIYNDKTQLDTTRLKAIHDIAWSFNSNNPDTAIILAEQNLQLAQETNQRQHEAIALNIIGASYINKGDYSKALNYFLKALNIFEELKDKKWIANCYINIGTAHGKRSNYPKALEYYLKALPIIEEINNKIALGYCFHHIGLIYYNQSDSTKAISYFLKSLKIREEIKDKQGLGDSYNRIGFFYMDKANYAKALEYFYRSLKLREEIGDKKGIADCYLSLGSLYVLKADEKGVECFLKGLKISSEIGYIRGKGLAYVNMSELYNALSNYKLAILYADSCLQIGKISEFKEGVYEAYKNLATAYSKTGKYKEAYECYVKYKSMTEDIFNNNNNKKFNDLMSNFEADKKAAEQSKLDALALKEKQQQKIILWSVVGGLILVILFALFVFRSLKTTREQKILIEEKQKEILDSIHYAKRIQTALITSEKYIDKNLKKLSKD